MNPTITQAPEHEAGRVEPVDPVVVSDRPRIERWAPGLAALAVFALRAVVIPTAPSEWDSVLILNGVRHFDVVRSAPHPPGSFLYVEVTALVHAITGAPTLWIASLLSAAMSAACAGIAWAVGRRLRTNTLGFVFALAVTANPVASFYGSIVATYTVDLLGGMVLLYCAIRARERPRAALVTAAVSVGLAAGARPSALVFSAPALLIIAVMARPKWRDLAWAVGALSASVLVWLVPLAWIQPGGLSAWRAATNATFEGQRINTSWIAAPAEARIRNVGTAFAYATIAVLPLLPAGLTAVAGRVWTRTRLVATEWWMLAVGVAIVLPGLLFGAFWHWGKSGYLLVFLPGLLVIPFVVAARLTRPWFAVFVALVCVGASFQMARFAFSDSVLPARFVDRGPFFTETRFWAPFVDTLGGRDKFDREHARAVSLLRDAGVTADDQVVMIDINGGPDFVHVAYAFAKTDVDYLNATQWVARANDGYLDRRASNDPNPVVPGPANGRVFLLLWNAPPELQQAVADGRATEVVTGNGESVWRVDAPVTIGRVTIGAR